MSEFLNEAKNLADQDPSLADQVVQDAGQFVEGKTGGDFDNQIQDAEQQADGWMGTDQNQQGN